MVKLKPLRDQAIVITGASSGIGLVTARTAARAGASVLMVARSEDVLRELVAELQAEGCRVEAKAADVGDPDGVKAAAAYAEQVFGRIDTWVNDAGVAIYARLSDTPLDEHERLFRTNYFGMVHGCQAALPYLRRHGGALITVGSVASEMPAPIMGAYSASKHAAKAYIDVLRMELAQEGAPVVVTLVKPAGIDTPIAQHAANHEGGEAQIPPPVYDPQLVADAILACAVRPTREVTVGGAARAQALFAAHFPALYEWLAPKAARSFVDKSRVQPTPDNIKWGVHAGEERSGEHPAARKTSLYTAAALHPKTTAAVGIGGVLLAAAGLAMRRRG
ncbi:SDR family oxidoreductase [Sphingomonas sp. KR1UV-12]|uniref:SDR family oxidoreductase n=1 Tax=Sphingomonas aurea TaxID=3063994 RepID=A0ABT9EK87_9SPHN|nr:SDR family oxidoreductase [Sphingomonas sp. KR1UV-12]MDP1027384.1 SDR family oxidoreductase [Sphingomonas sp. KR1UV-12]